MAEKLDEKEILSYKELLKFNIIQVDTLTQLLLQKGIITETEYFAALKQVQLEYNTQRPT